VVRSAACSSTVQLHCCLDRRFLGVGVLGYRYCGGLAWIDALVNASMILGGMGPVDPITSDAGKYFVSFYALFSGLLFIGAASIVVSPFVHRIMHRLHVEED